MDDVNDLPTRIARRLLPGSVDEVEKGRTGNRLLRAKTLEGADAYLKVATGATASELRAESERLQWIGSRLPIPRVLDVVERAGWTYLLITALEGTPGHVAAATAASEVVAAFATAMRDVHSLPVRDAPFRDVVQMELRESARRLTAGLIDEAAFEATVAASPAAVLLELGEAPPDADEVFTHGDFCLPNLLVRGRTPTGIVDWALAGVADRHRDFMSAEGTLHRNIGAAAVQSFYDAYGALEVDRDRVRWFWLLDQFSTFFRPGTS